jgi:diguanylate cyclase (GGDEF)-like protein
MNHTVAMPARRVLLVDDDPMMLRLLGQMLSHHADVSVATSAAVALRLMRVCAPDLVLVDVEMPGMSGQALCREIKADALLTEIPVIFVTNHHDPCFEASCFAIGAADFIHKPVQGQVLIARIDTQLRLRQQAEELRLVARLDPLTQCANRRVFDELLQLEWSRMQRNALPLSLAMVDIDHFKLFNDHYGHPAGDTCLQAVAEVLRAGAARSSDLIARYGGEEFVILLPETDGAGVGRVAEQLLKRLRAATLQHAASPSASTVTVSMGLSTFAPTAAFIARRTDPPPPDLPASADLIATADRALYRAKEAGRDRAIFLPFQAIRSAESSLILGLSE